MVIGSMAKSMNRRTCESKCSWKLVRQSRAPGSMPPTPNGKWFARMVMFVTLVKRVGAAAQIMGTARHARRIIRLCVLDPTHVVVGLPAAVELDPMPATLTAEFYLAISLSTITIAVIRAAFGTGLKKMLNGASMPRLGETANHAANDALRTRTVEQLSVALRWITAPGGEQICVATLMKQTRHGIHAAKRNQHFPNTSPKMETGDNCATAFCERLFN